jgi:hypothetical protein
MGPGRTVVTEGYSVDTPNIRPSSLFMHWLSEARHFSGFNPPFFVVVHDIEQMSGEK